MSLCISKDLISDDSRTDENFVIEKLMSRGRSIISLPKKLMRNIYKERIYPSIFDQLKLQDEFEIFTQNKHHQQNPAVSPPGLGPHVGTRKLIDARFVKIPFYSSSNGRFGREPDEVRGVPRDDRVIHRCGCEQGVTGVARCPMQARGTDFKQKGEKGRSDTFAGMLPLEAKNLLFWKAVGGWKELRNGRLCQQKIMIGGGSRQIDCGNTPTKTAHVR